MGAVTGLLGLGGDGGNISNPTNGTQISTANTNAQSAQQQQQALLAALQGQNGIQNQSQVYNQLQGVANGTGPNPAQAMLNQSTGQNVANQAALMAGQRGSGANVGLMARQAAQQGANTQQQAVGQAATLQANQSLGALGQAGSLATNQVGNQINATTANTQAAQSEQGINNQAQAGINNINSTAQNGVVGGLMNGAGGALSAIFAQGGEVEKFASGGQAPAQPAQSGNLTNFLNGWAGGGSGGGESNNSQALAQGIGSLGTGLGAMGSSMFSSAPAASTVPMPGSSMSDYQNMGASPNEQMSAYQALPDAPFAQGGNVGNKLKSGGHVPGTPKVPGNSYANDTVKALLSPGEVVIPNSVMQSKDPVRGAAQFVQAQLAKKRMRGNV